MPNGCVIKNIFIRFFSYIFWKVNKVNYGRLELMLKEQVFTVLNNNGNKSSLSLCAWRCVTYLLIYCLQETCEVGVVSLVLQVK